MPFEAGMAYAHSQATQGKHSFFVLEEVRYRLQKSLSDLNGIDPFIHGGKVDGVLKIVRQVLVPHTASYRPTIAAMRTVAEDVSISMRRLRRKGEIDSFFDADAFALAVGTATSVARRDGLISE